MVAEVAVRQRLRRYDSVEWFLASPHRNRLFPHFGIEWQSLWHYGNAEYSDIASWEQV